jgi:hypothetical protein
MFRLHLNGSSLLTTWNQSAKRMFARLEGHNDPKRLLPTSQFMSGGFGGMVAQ